MHDEASARGALVGSKQRQESAVQIGHGRIGKRGQVRRMYLDRNLARPRLADVVLGDRSTRRQSPS